MNYVSLRNPADSMVSRLLGEGFVLHSVSVTGANNTVLVYHFIKQ